MESYETPVTLSTKYLLMVKSDCYGNLLDYVFFVISEKKLYRPNEA